MSYGRNELLLLYMFIVYCGFSNHIFFANFVSVLRLFCHIFFSFFCCYCFFSSSSVRSLVKPTNLLCSWSKPTYTFLSKMLAISSFECCICHSICGCQYITNVIFAFLIVVNICFVRERFSNSQVVSRKSFQFSSQFFLLLSTPNRMH